MQPKNIQFFIRNLADAITSYWSSDWRTIAQETQNNRLPLMLIYSNNHKAIFQNRKMAIISPQSNLSLIHSLQVPLNMMIIIKRDLKGRLCLPYRHKKPSSPTLTNGKRQIFLRILMSGKFTTNLSQQELIVGLRSDQVSKSQKLRSHRCHLWSNRKLSTNSSSNRSKR